MMPMLCGVSFNLLPQYGSATEGSGEVEKLFPGMALLLLHTRMGERASLKCRKEQNTAYESHSSRETAKYECTSS
jgi:hypothetical protein